MFKRLTKHFLILSSLLIAASFFITSPASAASTLSGRILLQVENGGKAWYLDPVTDLRAFLGRPADAFNVMRGFGLGVSNSDFSKIRQSTSKRQSLSGRILIQVENKGAAFYVSPLDLTLNYLGRPKDAFTLMRTLALGISNKDLSKISVDPRYPDMIISTVATSTATSATSTPIVSNGKTIAANTCKSWTYTDWYPCTVYGNQTREVIESFPANCSGGNAVLEQVCGLLATTTATSTATTTIIATSTIATSSEAVPTLNDLLLSAAYLDNGKNVGVSCKPWVNKLASFITNGLLALPSLQANNYTWGPDTGNRVLYRSTAIENVARGDIIQYNVVSQDNLPHTMIVVTKTSTGMFVIHSNWRQANVVSVDFITFAYFNSAVGSQYSVYHIY